MHFSSPGRRSIIAAAAGHFADKETEALALKDNETIYLFMVASFRRFLWTEAEEAVGDSIRGVE